MSDFYIFLVAFAMAFAFTPINIFLSRKFGLIDVPKDNRRMHKKPIATAGGVAIFAAFILTVLLFIPKSPRMLYILAGAVVIALTGLVDDIKNISAKVKLVAQVAAAVIAICGGIKIQYFTNPLSSNSMVDLGLFGPVITVLWIVGVCNALNLIDGMDGLCSGLASISAFTFFIASAGGGFAPLVSLALAGAALGFLPYNFNPAKIFMGDTGALFIGYILAVVSIEGVVKSVAAISLIMPIFILALPVFDTLFAMLRRMINKKKIMEADKGHLHHRLVAMGYSVRQTVLILYLLSIVFSALAILISKLEPSTAIVISAVTILAVFVLATFFGMFRKEKKNKQEGIH